MTTISMRYIVDHITAEGRQMLVGNPSGDPVELLDWLVKQARPSGSAEK